MKHIVFLIISLILWYIIKIGSPVNIELKRAKVVRADFYKKEDIGYEALKMKYIIARVED